MSFVVKIYCVLEKKKHHPFFIFFLGGVGGRCGCDFARKVTRRVFFVLEM